MSNLEKYEPAVISNFEIFGCYFVDLFYNRIYMIAKRQKMEHSNHADEGLTAIYRRGVVDYVRSLKKGGQFIKDTVMQLMNTYQKFTNYNAITLIELQDIFLRNFMPKDHFVTLGATEKNFMLNKIIISIVEQFANDAVQTDFLCMVIDNHKVQKNTREWQNKILEIQVSIREDLFSKLARKELKFDNSNSSGNQQSDLAFDRLKAECNKLKKSLDIAKETIKKMLKEKCELEVKLERAKSVSKKVYDDLMRQTAAAPTDKMSYNNDNKRQISHEKSIKFNDDNNKNDIFKGEILPKKELKNNNFRGENRAIHEEISYKKRADDTKIDSKIDTKIDTKFDTKNDTKNDLFSFENLMNMDPLFDKKEDDGENKSKIEEIVDSDFDNNDNNIDNKIVGDDSEDDIEIDEVAAARSRMQEMLNKK